MIGWLFCAGHCRKRFNRYLRKFPDGTVIWTAPGGQIYTTMPRRTRTREQNRKRAIEAERQLNDEYVAERNRRPPF